MNNLRPKIGLLGLTLELYDTIPGLYEELNTFGLELVNILSAFSEVSYPGICYQRGQVDQAVDQFESQKVDLILVVFLSYSPSLITVPALLRSKTPVLIWNTQRLMEIPPTISSWETTKNHGMHGVQDLTNVLNRIGKKYEMITGHYQDADVIQQVKKVCEAARVAKWLKQSRIGLIGYAMEGMGDFALDETSFLAQLGVEIKHLSMREVERRAVKITTNLLHEHWLEDGKRYRIANNIDEKTYQASERLVCAIREMMNEYSLAGFASHFKAIGDEGILETLPFLASSKLLAEGYGFGGEGDVTSATMVSIMRQLAGAASFTEMFSMDFADNSILFMHMGEANYEFARQNEPINMVKSSLGLINLKVDPVLLAFGYASGEVTLASLTTTIEGQLKIVATEGKMLDFPYAEDLGRPHGKFQPSSRMEQFLTRYSIEGGSHHLALVYGKYAGHLEILARMNGLSYALV